MFNVRGGQQVPLDVFGGLVTNRAAIDLPPGVSPDCQDMAFRPGSTFTRPALSQVFEEDDDALGTYAKSYVDPEAINRNLYLYANGELKVENLTTSPGTKTDLSTLTSGSYAKSITAFGREYIATSNGFRGTDIPLQYDGTNLDRVTQDGPGAPPAIENLIIDPTTMDPVLSGTNTMERVSNVVTVASATPHGLKVGYRAEISNVTAAAVDTLIDTITIDDAQLPGQATVTMTAAHGLAPGTRVAIHDVPNTVVATITAIKRTGGIVQIVTTNPHGLQDGAVIELSGTSDPPVFDIGVTIDKVISPTAFVFFMDGADATPAGGGDILLTWPFPNTGANAVPGSVFEVLSCPTDDTFTIAINYSNGTWSGGGVTVPWVGTYFVTEVPTDSTFKYQQYAPDQITTETGTVTPSGQISPGKHRMRVSYLTRQGYITRPSPSVEFMANGGQYMSISEIPIGPANVVARILEFTSADGSYFFYIPVPAQVNGQRVSDATQINDNSTDSIVLDFSDNTLLAAISTSQPGNDTLNQVVIDSALGFAYFGSRLVTYGQRNRIQNLLNMCFDGGYLPADPAMPTGWTAAGGGAGGTLATTGRFGGAWHVLGAGSIYQSGYLDAYQGAPILTPNTQYTLRGWVKTSGATATVTISSASTAFSATATLTGATATGVWLEDDFSAEMPEEIPEDMIISVSGTGGAIIDELSIIYTEVPLINRTFYGSYVNNPEAFDGVSGVFGVDDSRKVMTVGIIRGNLYVLTQDPGGRLHQILNNGVTEPAGWDSTELAAGCGAMSTFCLTQSQADDASAGGGEEWFAWMSYTAPRIFGGDQPWSIGDEIRPNWAAINVNTWLTTWALNDPAAQRIYFGLPIGEAPAGGAATAPNKVYHVDYKHLDTAAEIAAASPIIGEQAQERARKWCPWSIPANGAAMIYRQAGGPLVTVFYGGNGFYPGTAEGGCANLFFLCPNKHTDDCLDQIPSYYITAAFTSPNQEIGGQRHLLQYLQIAMAGVHRIKITPLVNSLTNPWPITATMDLREDPLYDDEWGGGQASGQRFFLKFEGLPAA